MDRRIFISYAWGDKSEEGQRREQRVNDLVETLRTCGYEPLYDKERLKPGDVISSYMKLAGETAKVVVILSAKYLRSEYCMHEIMAAYQKCDDANQFRQRVISLALEDSKHFEIEQRAEHAKWWRERHKKLSRIAPLDMANEDFVIWKQMLHWALDIPNVLKAIADTIHLVGFEAITRNQFAQIRHMLGCDST